VIEQMEDLRKALFRFENFRILVIADLEKLSKPVSSWSPFLSLLKNTSLQPIPDRRALLSEAGKNLGHLSYVVPMPTIDSSFAYSTARGLDSYDHPNLPALLVAITFMNTVEGPLWVAVRGTGLAYGAAFSHNIDVGHVHFDVYRSPNAHKAFEASKQIVKDHITGAVPFGQLEGAISSIVVGFANDQATIPGAAQGSFIRQVMRNLPSDYMEKMLRKVREITEDEIKGALRDILMPLFEPATSNLVVTCATALEEPIREGLESSGFKPQIRALKHFEDDYGLKLDEDEEEDDDDDDDDDNEEGEGDDGDSNDDGDDD